MLESGHELPVVLLELDRSLERQNQVVGERRLLLAKDLPADQVQIVERLRVVPLPEGEARDHLLEFAYPLRDGYLCREEAVGAGGKPFEFVGCDPHHASIRP